MLDGTALPLFGEVIVATLAGVPTKSETILVKTSKNPSAAVVEDVF